MPAPAVPAFAVSGSIGNDWTYSRNQHGPFVAPFGPGYHPPVPDPTGRLLALRELTATWHTLTHEQRAAWRGYARRFALPNYTAYIHCNLLRYSRGQAPITSPP